MCHNVKQREPNAGARRPPKPCTYRPGPRSSYFALDCLNDVEGICLLNSGQPCHAKQDNTPEAS
jgi:hypothetical protein